MASIYRAKYPRVRTAIGKRVVVRGSDGKPVYRQSKRWTIEYTDAGGKRKRVAGYTDKAATEEKLRQLVRYVERHRVGIFTVPVEHAGKPVSEHIEAWVADLRRAGRSPEYIRKVKPRIERLADELSWIKVSSINPDGMCRWLSANKSKMSDRTSNHYIETGRAFCNWCVSHGRMESNPLASVGKTKVAEDNQRQRRAASVKELQRLLATAPPHRAAVYAVAALTGLRRSELKALQWGNVHLDGDSAHIALRASTTKSTRGDSISLNAEAVEWLQGSVPDAANPCDAVFASVPKLRTFYDDLERAGIEPTVDGKTLDFHALRTTYGTMLAASGVSVRVAMECMRHTDVRLTTRVYTDPRLLDTRQAVGQLPRLTGPSPQRQRATGTDGSDIGRDIGWKGSEACLNVPDRAGKATRHRPSPKPEKPAEQGSFGDSLGAKETARNWRRGESNPP